MRAHASRGLVLLVVLACLTGGTALAYPRSPASSQAAPTKTLVIANFEATVYQGPDKGLSLRGTLTLHRARTGAVTGQFTPARRPVLAVSGQLTGYALNLVFSLGHGQEIFGVGTIGRDPGTKQGVAGGPLVGPQQGDSGAWAAAQGGAVQNSIWLSIPSDSNQDPRYT